MTTVSEFRSYFDRLNSNLSWHAILLCFPVQLLRQRSVSAVRGLSVSSVWLSARICFSEMPNRVFQSRGDAGGRIEAKYLLCTNRIKKLGSAYTPKTLQSETFGWLSCYTHRNCWIKAPPEPIADNAFSAEIVCCW